MGSRPIHSLKRRSLPNTIGSWCAVGKAIRIVVVAHPPSLRPTMPEIWALMRSSVVGATPWAPMPHALCGMKPVLTRDLAALE
eukprot:9288795-Pyramimonas_sp.AAC.1